MTEEREPEPETEDVWYAALRSLCEEVRADLRSGYAIDVTLFYVARWCQKKARLPEPALSSFSPAELRATVERIAGHLAEHGSFIERLVEGDSAAMRTLRGYVAQSAASRAPAAASDFADEAVQKVSLVLLTGTSPSQAPARLLEGPRGPGGEYVFSSPFPNWAQTVVINLIKDEWRRASRHGPDPGPGGGGLDRELIEGARAALPGLLDAIRGLPPMQRRVLVLSLCRSDLDIVIRRRVQKLAPDLFADEPGVVVSSDSDIAERIGSTPHRVAANRSVARGKLAPQHEQWPFLLDLLLPHRSTRRSEVQADV